MGDGGASSVGWGCCKEDEQGDRLPPIESWTQFLSCPSRSRTFWKSDVRYRKIPERTAIICLPRDSGLSIQADQNLDHHCWAACIFFLSAGNIGELHFLTEEISSIQTDPYLEGKFETMFSLKCVIHVSLFKQRWMILCMFHVPHRNRSTDWAVGVIVSASRPTSPVLGTPAFLFLIWPMVTVYLGCILFTHIFRYSLLCLPRRLGVYLGELDKWCAAFALILQDSAC